MRRHTRHRVHRSAVPLLLLFAAIVLVLPGCATTSSRRHRSAVRTVVDHGISLLGQKKVRVGRKPFRNDCSGFVTACYSTVGTALIDYGVRGDTGTEMIYRTFKAQRRVHNRKRPLPGDLAFFHNTHDRNGNGLRDDYFTHIALVESVGDDGTVRFLHFASGRVQRDHLNRFHRNVARDPDSGRVWNDPIRRGGGRTLAGQLLFRFASPLPKKQ